MGRVMNLINNDFHRADTDLRNEILEEVRNNLSQMKPEIISSIIEEIVSKMYGRYASRIGKPENRISELERRASDAQEATVRQKTPIGSPSTAKKIDTSRIIYSAFHFDGWIYYPNKNMGNFLYRVREDGCENTQLTDYSVELVARVEGGYLYYLDGTYKERKLKLS